MAAAAGLAGALALLRSRLGRAPRARALLAVAVAGAIVVGWTAATASWAHPLHAGRLGGKLGLLIVVAGALAAGGVWRARPGRASTLVAAGVLAAVGLLGGAAWASASARHSLRVERPWNVVLVGIDTLRADHALLTAPPAGGRDLTPHLRSLAARATVYEAAVSPSCWTLPSFGSILTGRYPRQHGATQLFGRLPAREITLAEILGEAGYRTGAVVSHLYVDADRGFRQGFDTFDQACSRGHEAITSSEVTDRALRFVDGAGEDPFLLFVHYFDPHYEFRDHPKEPFSDGYRGWLRDEPMSFDNLEQKRHLLDPDDLSFLTGLYAEEVAHTDAQVGRLLSGLGERGLSQRTLIVVVSDHGEEFLEHGWLGHSTGLYEPAIRVPLVVAAPGRPPGTVRRTVETRAILPTVLRDLGLRGGRAEGPALALVDEGPMEDEGDPAFSSVEVRDARLESGKRVRLSAVRTNRWKLIVDHVRRKELLFDLAADPGETRDLAGEDGPRRRRLRALLDGWIRAPGGEAGASEPDRALEERLRSLGYL
jgi:arylsulfatase A-like enzyme